LSQRKTRRIASEDDGGMSKRILVIQAHPDASRPHFCHALAESYAKAARSAGHEVRIVDVASLSFPLLRSQAEWTKGDVPAGLASVQDDIRWAQHLVFFYPLWLGSMPALLKGFLEQVARPGFAIGRYGEKAMPRKLLAGRSARIVVTMGMPAPVFRWFFFAHSLKALKRNILGFVGISPVRDTLVGSIEGMSPAARGQWLQRMGRLGAAGE
jgi:putative NADPH-quinone reductase